MILNRRFHIFTLNLLTHLSHLQHPFRARNGLGRVSAHRHFDGLGHGLKDRLDFVVLVVALAGNVERGPARVGDAGIKRIR